jgi:organic hydroperoxide reductase OsmC/OhrA
MPAKLRESSASIRWLTRPSEGVPRLTVDSHTFPTLPVSINNEAPHPLATSPGELMAGAFGSVFAWMLAEELLDDGTQALELEITVTLAAELGHDGGDPALCEIHCHAIGRFPGGDPERLQALCETAMTRSGRAIGLRDEIATRVDSTAIAAR